MTQSGSTILKLAAAASVALSGAALAHPHEGAGAKQSVQKVIIINKHDGKPGSGAAREFRMMQSENGDFSCPDSSATKVDETTGGDHTKILICADDKLPNAERAKKLEEALARIHDNDQLSGEHKAKVEAALQGAIARLRASN
jgi:hypothetical protein